MKKTKKNKLLMFLCIGLFTIITATGCGCSCTSSMCSEQDINNIKQHIEKTNIEKWRNTAALSMNIESEEYTAYANAKVEEMYLDTECGKSGTCTTEQINSAKADIRTKNNNLWLNELEELSPGDKGYIKTRSESFEKFVDEKIEEIYASHPKACLVIEDDVDPQTGATLEAKTWGDAWKTGLLEGLIVYPLSWLLTKTTNSFGGNGFAALFAIVIIVLIIRVFMLIVNFKGQISTIKMTEIQPELLKLNERMKDPNLTQNEKQALSMKMMDIYKKNNINPFISLLTNFISFPIFIAVWAAMNQTLAIRKGTLLGMELGEKINTQIFSGNIAAILLFVLMIVGQIFTMKISVWLRNWKEKKKNPHYQKAKSNGTDSSMNKMMIFMIVLIVTSGFVLPAALIIYWFLGSVFSILQTIVFSTEFVNKKLKSFADRKKRVKVVR